MQSSEIFFRAAWLQPTMPNNYGRSRWGAASPISERFWYASLWKTCTVQFVAHFNNSLSNTNMPQQKTLRRRPSRLMTCKNKNQEASSRRSSITKNTYNVQERPKPEITRFSRDDCPAFVSGKLSAPPQNTIFQKRKWVQSQAGVG